MLRRSRGRAYRAACADAKKSRPLSGRSTYTAAWRSARSPTIRIKLLENLCSAGGDRHRERAPVQKQIQERNAELREALEHQTATAEVLGIISRSPTDVQPVLDAIVESAARVCGIDDVVLRLREGNSYGSAGSFWSPYPSPASRSVLMSHSFAGCASMARSTFPTSARRTISNRWVCGDWRTFLVVPLRQQGNSLERLTARRIEVRPFTPAQIKLLETFADQAVIAIENVRLFKELQERNRDLTESLEQQTATSEVLRVIASSPTELQPVLDTVIANAVTLAGAKQGHIRQYDGEFLRVVAHYNETAEQIAIASSAHLPDQA